MKYWYLKSLTSFAQKMPKNEKSNFILLYEMLVVFQLCMQFLNLDVSTFDFTVIS